MTDNILFGQHIKVTWNDGQQCEYRVAEDSTDGGDVVAHRWIERRKSYATWTAKVPRKFITRVTGIGFVDNR